MHGSESVGGQCKTSERSVPGKALKGHTFREFAARAILLSARTLAKETPGVRVTIFIFRAKCVSLTAIPRRRGLNILRRMN